MPSISMFYGIIIYMYFKDNKQHNKPHIHVRVQEQEVVVAIPDGEILEGSIPNSKMKLLQAWIELRKDELVADWNLAVSGEQPYKIEPLRLFFCQFFSLFVPPAAAIIPVADEVHGISASRAFHVSGHNDTLPFIPY